MKTSQRQAVGEAIRACRRSQRMTQYTLYVAAFSGTPYAPHSARSTMSRYESGTINIPLGRLLQLANALGMTAGDLLREAGL